MKRTSEIRAVEMVRQIRDAHAEQLAGKSPAEVMEFFNRTVAPKKGRSKQTPAKTQRLVSR